ncbi:hypothetical protein HYU09_00785 [Candidatus Woesearchaeota archaeon]|nr:hypothetical protein [Candidatus Woesearchaeota archaeon]
MRNKLGISFLLLFFMAIAAYSSLGQDISDRKYVSQDPSVCKTIKFDCEEGRYFSDESGCGCTIEDFAEDRSGPNRGPEGFDDEMPRGEFSRNFEGISKNDMVFEMVFEILGDEVDESEVMPYCNDPDKIADIIIGKAKDKIGDVSNACDKAGEMEASCREEIGFHCSFGRSNIEEARDELEKMEILANSCPVNKEAIIKLCVFRSKEYMEQQQGFLEQECGYEWEDYGQQQDRNCELELKSTKCDEDDFIEECMIRWGAYKCEDVPYPKEECSGYWDQKYDDKGCIKEYFCVGNVVEKVKCPDAKMPECGENAHADDFYDNNGCMYYQCVQKEASCPRADIGQCNAGESLELKYDDKGCVVGYECRQNAACGDGICNADSENEASCESDCGKQCPFTNEEAERMANECINNNGAPEKVFDGECITDIRCTIDDSGNGITGNVVGITGRQVLDDYDDFKAQCRKEWEYQEAYCGQMPKGCGKDNFIGSCMERRKKDFERESSRTEQRCELDSRQQIRQMERECSRMGKETAKCYEEGERRCGQFSGISERCEERLTESNFREFIIKEAKKRCKFAEQYFKESVYSNKPRQVVEKILELKQRGVPGEFTGILDEEANGLLEVSDSLEELGQREEEKSLGYKIKLFLGFAKEMEESEIQSLERSKQSLESSIKSLSSLADQVTDENAKAILKAQVADLERQMQDINGLIEQKEKKSKGLLRLFGLFG